MKSSITGKFIAAAALAVVGLGAVSAAHAGSNLHISIGVQGAPVYYEPAPVYVQPRQVYVAPRQVYVQPQPVYQRHDDDDDDDRGWRHAEYGSYKSERRDHHADRFARRFGPYGDLDRDGIINRDDRDRDGDGIRNRYDRFPDNPYRY